MLRNFAGRLTYANVMSTVAVFVALGGSSYAVTRIDGNQLKNRSVSGKKLKRNTLGSTVVKESRLGKVPRARRADTLQGLVPSQFKLTCPTGTKYNAGVCIERTPRLAAPYGVARVECESRNRRLPSYQELAGIIGDSDIPFGSGGELAAEVYPATSGDTPNVLVVTTLGGGVALTPDTFAGRRPFRCVAYPTN